MVEVERARKPGMRENPIIKAISEYCMLGNAHIHIVIRKKNHT